MMKAPTKLLITGLPLTLAKLQGIEVMVRICVGPDGDPGAWRTMPMLVSYNCNGEAGLGQIGMNFDLTPSPCDQPGDVVQFLPDDSLHNLAGVLAIVLDADFEVPDAPDPGGVPLCIFTPGPNGRTAQVGRYAREKLLFAGRCLWTPTRGDSDGLHVHVPDAAATPTLDPPPAAAEKVD